MGRGQHGCTGRAEDDSAYSQQKPKNKDTQAKVKEERQNIKLQSPSQGSRQGSMARRGYEG